MSRPGLLDWLCQKGKTIFRIDRMPIDGKSIVGDSDKLKVDTTAILAANGGLESGADGLIGVKTDGTLQKKNNAIGLSTTANAPSADKWKTARSFSLTGGATGTASGVDGSKDVSIDVTGLDMSKATAGTLAAARGGTGRTDGKVAALATSRTIDGVDFNGSAAVNHYTTCSTAAATAAKVADLTGFKLVTGGRVTIKFTVTNTAANPTLNVNNTGAKAIKYRGAAIAAGILAANRVYEFVYDGTDWQFLGDTDTTYTPASAAPKAHGTAAVGTSAKYAREDHVHPAQTTLSGNANTATKLATARGVDGVNFDGSADIIHYGTCATAAGTAAKVVALAGFKLVTGSRVAVRFTVSNTANNPTLNVNNTGAKAIRYRNAAIERYYLEANRTYEFIYDGTAWQLIGDLNCPYELCEFYYFRHPTLRSGFQPLTGGVIANANTKYPLAWAYLGTTEGQKLCTTESAWQAMSTKNYYTLADGTKLGFNGIGGVPLYVRDTAKNTLRMPDIRGTYPEPAGFDSLNVGDADIDRIRNIFGEIGTVAGSRSGIIPLPVENNTEWGVGALYATRLRAPDYQAFSILSDVRAKDSDTIRVDSARTLPSAIITRPRSFGVLACAYLGTPAS